jgi:tRNA A37 threonylcarbamoyladenosine synthetase subunit TsaC/SUA5/YrdC
MTAKTPATKLDDVEKSIIDAADLVIDGGQTKYRSPSLVIDLVDGKVLREGRSESISIAELPER